MVSRVNAVKNMRCRVAKKKSNGGIKNPRNELSR